MYQIHLSSISVGLILVISASLTKFGFSISLIGLTIAGITSISSYFCHQSKTTVLSSWLILLRKLSEVSIASHGLSILLDFMNDKQLNSYIHLIPTTTMPHVMPILVIVIMSVLFILGLETSKILEALLKAFLVSIVLLFLITSVTLLHHPESKVLEIPENPVQQILLTTAFFWSWFPEDKKTLDYNDIFEHLLKHGVFTATIILIIFVPHAECVMFGLICPVAHWYPWFEPIMVCLTLSSLCLALPQIFSNALHYLITSSNFKLTWFFKENQKLGTHVRGVLIVGIISIILVYFHTMYVLMLLCSSCILLSHIFDTIMAINEHYQPFFVPRDTVYYIKLALFGEKVKSKKKRSKYISLNENFSRGKLRIKEEDSNVLVDSSSEDSGHSSDTDIDSVVAEYVESIKFKAFSLNRNNRDPTIQSGRLVAILLLLILLGSSLCSYGIMNHFHVISIPTFLGILPIIFIIYLQPQNVEIKKISGVTIFKYIIIVTYEIILLGTVFAVTIISMIIWVFGGMSCVAILNKFKASNRQRAQQINFQPPQEPLAVGSILSIQQNVPYESVQA